MKFSGRDDGTSASVSVVVFVVVDDVVVAAVARGAPQAGCL